VREALHQLIPEGLVVHEHNVGFAVARLSVDEFRQIYMLRGVIETEVLRSLPVPTKAQLAEIERLHKAIAKAGKSGNLVEMKLLNRDFHFAIFRMSPLGLLVRELERIWTWALPYHEVYLHTEEGRKRVEAEHAEMVRAVADQDHDEIIRLMNLHRGGASQQMSFLLEGAGVASPKSARKGRAAG
jgi:DNA-binding GntR family transcriptional regulator